MGSKKKTHKEFIDELRDVNSNIEVVGEYVGAKNKVLVRCKIHNFEFSSYPSNLLRGKGCRICGNLKISDSKRHDFNNIAQAFIDRELELLSNKEEINNLAIDKLRYVCPTHGEQTILWGNFIKGAGCRKCADKLNSLNIRKETWIRIENYFQHSEYKLVSKFDEYTGANDSCLRCVCKKHGEFKISWSNLNKFEGCPICNSSTGERKILYYLKENNIKFQRQYKFDDLIGVGGKRLSYDFYLSDYGILIEYQGQQHAAPSTFYSIKKEIAELNFIKQQEHDKRKRDYANKKGYKLLEIWYYDFCDIESILNDYLIIQN